MFIDEAPALALLEHHRKCITSKDPRERANALNLKTVKGVVAFYLSLWPKYEHHRNVMVESANYFLLTNRTGRNIENVIKVINHAAQRGLPFYQWTYDL